MYVEYKGTVGIQFSSSGVVIYQDGVPVKVINERIGRIRWGGDKHSQCILHTEGELPKINMEKAFRGGGVS